MGLHPSTVPALCTIHEYYIHKKMDGFGAVSDSSAKVLRKIGPQQPIFSEELAVMWEVGVCPGTETKLVFRRNKL